VVKKSLILGCLGALLSILLLGCSSGGGSGGGGSSDGMRVSFSTNRISGSFPSCCITNQQVTVTVAGNPGVDTVYASARVTGNGFLPPNVVYGSNYGTVYLEPIPNLRAGTYSGNLVISLCADAGCSRHLGSSPYSIPYEFTVTPNDWSLFIEERGNLATFNGESAMYAGFQVEEGANPLTTRLVLESADRYTSFSFAPEIYNDFDVQVSGNYIDITPLPHPVGDYFFTYTINRTSIDGTNPSTGINISLKVSPEGVDPNKLAILDKEVVVRLGAALPESFTRSANAKYYVPHNDTSLQLLRFSIRYLDGQDWISDIRTTTSSVPPFERSIYITVNNAMKDLPGLYRADITATSAVGGQDTFRVVRDLYTGFDDHFVEFILGGESDERVTSRIVGVNVLNSQPFQWWAEKDGDWFDIDTKITDIVISVGYEAIVNMQNGEAARGSITLKSDHPEIADYTFPVTAQKRFTEIQFFEPAEVVAGQPFILTVRGKFLPDPGTTAWIAFSDGSFGTLSYNNELATYQITHDGISLPGEYKFHAPSSLEWKADNDGFPGLRFVPDSSLRVVDESQAKSAEKLQWRIQPIK